MSKLKLPHASGNSMSIAAPATNPASDLELKLPATIGSAGQVLRNSSTPGTLEFGGGIQEFDMWRINSSSSLAGDTDITANWERADTDFEKIGTGLTESSGIFTFPSTGKWLIGAFAYVWTSAGPDYAGIGIFLSTDSGGSYEKRTETLTSINNDESAGSVLSTVCFDITNSATARMKLVAITATTVQYNGHTSQNRTGLWAIKLGDT